MKVYISADIEGVSGVVTMDSQIMPTGSDYSRARTLMTAEVNAAIRGALKAGAKEVVVNDSHGTMDNILIEKLNPAAQLISGRPKPLLMMEGIDETFQAAFFVGYHSRMGSPGVLSHTISSRSVANVWINGAVVGETAINAGIAGVFGVPVVLVCGDDVLEQEAKQVLPHARTAVVKMAITRQSALCLPPERACSLIENAAEEALSSLAEAKPWLPDAPVTIDVEFKDSGMAENASGLPYSQLTGPRVVSFKADDYLMAFKGLVAMIALA